VEIILDGFAISHHLESNSSTNGEQHARSGIPSETGMAACQIF
jgi:hypothetical protein